MSLREVFYPRVPLIILRTLTGILVFALFIGGMMENCVLTPSVYAQESDGQEADTPQSEEQEEDAAEDSEEEEADPKPSDPPAKKPKKDEPVKNGEQEKAEEAAGEEVSEEREAADKREDEAAAEEEAAGAEVEIDESDEDEVEPAESRESPNKPPVEEEPVPAETPVPKRIIGATATIMEKQSELLFKARVDSGAKSCSLHIEDFKIENASEQMADNIGRVITFNIKNGNNESHWLQAKIAGYVIVKNATHRERRYKVPLTLRYKDFEKTVLVTLNNREKMEYPLLLGRNFLINDFVVDVSVENGEQHSRATLN